MATINDVVVLPINGVIDGTDNDETIIAVPVDTGTVLLIRGHGGNDTIATSGDNMTLDGGAGVDTVQSSGLNNTLLGGEGGDTLQSLEGADNTTMDGGAGGDTLIGGGTNDTASYASAQADVVVDLSTFSASDGDLLLGIENVTGSDYNDTLTGDDPVNVLQDGEYVLQGGENVLQGGAGNDTLTGNGGDDVFKFNFTQGGGETSRFTDFFAAHGGTVVDTVVDGEVVGKEVANGTSQGQFSSLYTQWLESLGLTVLDLGQNSGPGGMPVVEGPDGTFGERESFEWTSGSAKKAVTHERWYSDTWSSGDGQDAVTSNDGLDTILDFTPGEDKLNFSGITQEQFQNLFNVVSTVDTVITINGFDGWSVTLSGVSSFDFVNDAVFS